jgi:hypothetical protein
MNYNKQTIYGVTLDRLAECFTQIRNSRYTEDEISELVDRLNGMIEELNDKVPRK